jgi:C4-type Zn-finger protein
VNEAAVHTILQSHQAGVSIRGSRRVSRRAINTVTGVIQRTSEKAQMVHNQAVTQVETDTIAADELWSYVDKTKRNAFQKKTSWAMVGLA